MTLNRRMAYLQVALEEFDQDGDTEHLMLALRNVAEARGGVPELARQVKMGKTSLYKALSEKGNPTLSTVGTILHGLGYRLAIAPVPRKLRRKFMSQQDDTSITRGSGNVFADLGLPNPEERLVPELIEALAELVKRMKAHLQQLEPH